MALFSRKRGKPRRVERVRPEGDVPWYRRLGAREARAPLAVLAGFFVAAVVTVQLPRRPLPYRLGEQVTQPVRSRAAFSHLDREATQKVRELAALRVPGVYKSDVRGIAALRQSLAELVQATADAPSLEEMPEPILKRWPLDADLFARIQTALGEEAAKLEAVKKQIADATAALADPTALPVLQEEDLQRESARLQEIKEAVANLPPYVSARVLLPEKPSTAAITLATDGLATLALKDVLRQTETSGIQDRLVDAVDPSLGPVFGQNGLEQLAGPMGEMVGPTLTYDRAATDARRTAAREDVAPIRREYVRGSVLVEADWTAPTTITEAHLQLLEEEQEAYRDALGLARRAMSWVGVAAVIAALGGLAAAYTWRFERGIARSVPRSFVLCLLALVIVGGAKAIAQAGGHPAFHVLLLVTAAMIVTIAYAQAYALAVAGVLVVLVAIAVNAQLDWAIVTATGTAVAVLALGEINNRSKLIKVGALAGGAMLVVMNALALWRLEWTPATLWQALPHFVAGWAAGFVMLGLLPFIERAFGIVTNISLLELCDVNQPALKRLALEAPGTYTHSLLIGTLAEAAAEAIGANGLLARVGAYFHDIGKTNKPRYYIENWQQEKATHEGLTPQMSRLVITSHVKDGLEMADRLGLPPVIKRFIQEHHGTTLVEYFYREAERRKTEEGGDAPKEEDYRYPGPKPQSPETAIVMLADAVEGATRSLKEHTPAKIKATVHEMVMKRLLDGQLDSSGLTLSDLHRIEETLTKTLLSVYHGRVPYPADKTPPAPGPAPAKGEPAPAAPEAAAEGAGGGVETGDEA